MNAAFRGFFIRSRRLGRVELLLDLKRKAPNRRACKCRPLSESKSAFAIHDGLRWRLGLKGLKVSETDRSSSMDGGIDQLSAIWR